MMNAEKIAKMLDVKVCDGWYYVADIATVDGNLWVCEADFLEIVKELLGE